MAIPGGHAQVGQVSGVTLGTPAIWAGDGLLCDPATVPAGLAVLVPGQSAAFRTNTATAGVTLSAANITGGISSVDLAMTGAMSADANVQLPTVAAMVALMQNPVAGSSFRLRIINESTNNQTWTVTTNTGWTLTGTMTIAQNTWREFIVTLTSLTAATLQNTAVGTFS